MHLYSIYLIRLGKIANPISCLMHLFDKYFVILVERMCICDARGVSSSLLQAVNNLFKLDHNVMTNSANTICPQTCYNFLV